LHLCDPSDLVSAQRRLSSSSIVYASGAWNHYEAEAAMNRISHAGGELETVFALGCELQVDWKLPSTNNMLDHFIQSLPEYGFALQNF